MNANYRHSLPIGLAALALLSAQVLAEPAPAAARPEKHLATGGGDISQMLASWPERPRLGAQQMIAKYGAPQEATSEKLVWHKPGTYKRITVTKSEDHHDFPLPHMDYMEHTIDYRVPNDKADELMKFDGSLTFDKTRGEMSARCDLEGHNILTLNIANDIVTGKKDAEEARKSFGQNVADDMAGKYPPYTVALQFEAKLPSADSDKPSMPGAPKRAMKTDAEVKDGGKSEAKTGAKSETAGDAETLAVLLAVDTNEIVAAMEAAKKKLSPEILEYAKMMHTEHGKNAADTMKLGQKIEVMPMDTEKTNQLRIKGAGELAALVPLDDAKFGSAYIDTMVKGHSEVLAMIDNELLKSAQNDSLKKHLAETREHVAMHLDAAKKLQGNAQR